MLTRIKYSVSILVSLIVILSCSTPVENEKLNNYETTLVEGDFSSIENPYERWKAYGLADYYIEQSWSCFCIPPLGCETYILSNEIEEIKYELDQKFKYDRTDDEIYRQTKNTALSINEAFELIEKFKSKAEKFEVEYDGKYGFPTRIYIDEFLMIADDERTIRFSNLMKIKK